MGSMVNGGFQNAVNILRAKTRTHRHLRNRLLALFIVTVVMTLLFALGMYLIERNARGADIHSYATAVYWSTAQLLTYGSSLSDPVTHGGRILEIMMDVYGLVVIGTLTASIGAYFIGRAEQQLEVVEQTEGLPSEGEQ
jgi:multisubunit Na+/H+ antiporter MnhG subunit